MDTCVIFCAAEFHGLIRPIESDDYVLAADGGLRHLEALGITQSAAALNGLWIVYALVPVIGMIISTFFYMGYKLNDKDVQIMAKCNSGEITREEAEKLLSRKY